MNKKSYKEELEKAYAISSGHEAEIKVAKNELKERAASRKNIWVVLDDDPTGIQTVHDVAVYTDWEEDTLFSALTGEKGMFYILTNSRGVVAEKSEQLHKELMNNLINASKRSGVSFSVISRGDSTLRGHFPLETDIIKECMENGLGETMDGLILAPFFYAGGRVTCEDIHYVRYKDELVPAGETEFAKDETFGYKNSNLGKYVQEKSGSMHQEKYISIPLELLRGGDLDKIESLLLDASCMIPIIVNALEPQDLEVFCAALYRVLEKGKHFVYRTAADFVKAVGAISDKELLTSKDMDICEDKGGIVMIGSHTAKTTSQLDMLRDLNNLRFIEYDSDKVLTGELESETMKTAKLASELIEQGMTPVLYTKRKVLGVPGDTKESALIRSAAISDAFTDVVSKLKISPSFIVGKGGITSSDIGIKALKVKRAVALGQIQPGVPVWKTDETSRFPGIPYIIFPGNVGEEDTLLKAVTILCKSK